MNRIPYDITIEQLQEKLRYAHEQIGFYGRFAFTIDQDGKVNLSDPKAFPGCYITHWFRPTPYAFEDCKVIGSGTPAACLVALENYVSSWKKRDKAAIDRKETAGIIQKATLELQSYNTTEETST